MRDKIASAYYWGVAVIGNGTLLLISCAPVITILTIGDLPPRMVEYLLWGFVGLTIFMALFFTIEFVIHLKEHGILSTLSVTLHWVGVILLLVGAMELVSFIFSGRTPFEPWWIIGIAITLGVAIVLRRQGLRLCKAGFALIYR